MTKKEYLVKLLSVVWDGTLNIAPDILYLIENNNIDDNIIDSLYEIFHNAIKATGNIIQKTKLQKWLNALDKIKSLEKAQGISDQKDIQDLDDFLKNI